MWAWHLTDELEKQQGTSSILHQALCIISRPLMNSNCSNSPEIFNSGQHWWFYFLCELEIWQMNLKNNRAPLRYYIKLCASFQSHLWIQTGVTGRKRSIVVKNGDFLSRVTLKNNAWPWKTTGHLLYATSSSVHHFIANCEFKLGLQSGNAQFRSESTFFLAMWP